MLIDRENFPKDVETLQQMLYSALSHKNELHLEIDKLHLLIHKLQRHSFGSRSEQLTPGQLQLGLEDLEQAEAEKKAEQDAAEAKKDADTTSKPKRPERNRGALPKHLQRYEVFLDAEHDACPHCQGQMHCIGEDLTEQLDIVPAQLRVRVTRRPRYACRQCEEVVVSAPAPGRPIDGGMATEALIAHVVVSKFADSLPLYRQAQILGRQGINLDRSTLANWVGRACWWLKPLYELLLKTIISSPTLFADDTTLPVLEPGRGRTKTGRLWCYAVDNRPWQGPGYPAAAYIYAEDRKSTRPAEHLAGFKGLLHVDGYAGFKKLASDRKDQSITLAFCWVHARRNFYKIYKKTKSPLAEEALKRIASLYRIEAEIRGQSAEQRRQVRQERSKPIADALHTWLQEQQRRVFGAIGLGPAITYALNHWPGLLTFLEDGRAEMDTNTVENDIRPVTLNRKNALFAGSDRGAQHWAIAMTMITTAKLNGVDPMAYLADVLERMVSGQTKCQDLDTLLPWNWKKARNMPISPQNLAA